MDRVFAFLVLLGVLAGGCDGIHMNTTTLLLAPTGTATLHASDGSWTVTATERGGVELFEGSDSRIDATFATPRLHDGKALLAEGSALSLASRQTRAGHHALSFDAPSADVRVQGVREDGVLLDVPGTGDGAAGLSSAAPTSVHRRVVCRDDVCTEIIEYDYESTKSGTSMWTAEPHAPVAVDRVRVVAAVPSGAVLSPSIRLSGFESLTLRTLD